MPEFEEKYYTVRGNIFHKVMANLVDNKVRKDTWIDSEVNRLSEEAKSENRPTHDKTISEYTVKDLIKQGLIKYRKELFNRPNFKTLNIDYGANCGFGLRKTIEIEFQIPLIDLETNSVISKFDLLGLIDEISYDDTDGITIRDHKLHTFRPSDFELSVNLQLALYAYVFTYLLREGYLKLGNIEMPKNGIKVGLNSFQIKYSKTTKKKYISYKFLNRLISPEEIHRAPYLAAEAMTLVGRMKNPIPNPQSTCNYMCAYQDLCQMWSAGNFTELENQVDLAHKKLDEINFNQQLIGELNSILAVPNF